MLLFVIANKIRTELPFKTFVSKRQQEIIHKLDKLLFIGELIKYRRPSTED